MNIDSYQVIGLMSGTSLDGLDIAHCSFKKDKYWSYAINAAETVKYPKEIQLKLADCTQLSGLELSQLHVDLGVFTGNAVKHFLNNHKLSTDFIASHGHTVFHQPVKGLTLQIGSAAHIAASTNLPVIADFRTKDVALGGNGAPLVPIGDELLFTDFDACLNLGGIANISFNQEGKRLAYDICPFNLVFNHLANKLGMEYDSGGKETASGKMNVLLFENLNKLPFYKQQGPKSLGWEWINSEVFPLLDHCDDAIQNQLHTFCCHVVTQIAAAFPLGVKSILVTGGGAFHKFFIAELRKQCPIIEITVPEPLMVNFKEALIFGFLGVLRWRGEVNCLQSVTGASSDSIGGLIYL